MTAGTGPAAPSYREALDAWIRVALQSFGGPAGQIAVMHRIVVDEKRWVDEPRFLHALSFCTLLPGPEAQQLATYLGWLLHGTKGGLAAGVLFVLPGFVSILLLSLLYVTTRDVGAVQGLFFGVKAAVVAVVVEALLRIARRSLVSPAARGVAVASFLAIFAFDVPFPWIVAVAFGLGFALDRLAPGAFARAGIAGDDASANLPPRPRTIGRSVAIATIGCALWFVPIVLLAAALGRQHVLVQQALFFSKTAVVTFGGAYAVLGYLAQQAVGVFGWVTPGEMLDGLGLAETTPGPLIQVVQFVAFLGAHRQPGGLDPMTAAIAASAVATWVTYVPCFLWVFLGAPYVEALRHSRVLSAGLAAIMAAVVGVIAKLALWFALHVIFARVGEVQRFGLHLAWPDPSSLDVAAAAVSAGAALLLFRLHRGMLTTLGASAAAGVALHLAGLA